MTTASAAGTVAPSSTTSPRRRSPRSRRDPYGDSAWRRAWPPARRRAPSSPWGRSSSRREQARLEHALERLADGGELDAVEDLLVEAAYDQELGFGARQPAGHAVEELVAVHLAHGGAVRAAHVVGEDLEAGDRVRVRLRREEQVAVLLVRVRLLRVPCHADHPAPDGGGRVPKDALEGEVRGRVRREVLLERVVVEVLRPVREVGPRHAGGRALPGEVVLDADLALVRAEAAGDPVELGVAVDARPVRGEVPGLVREVLNRDVFELRARLDEELHGR